MRREGRLLLGFWVSDLGLTAGLIPGLTSSLIPGLLSKPSIYGFLNLGVPVGFPRLTHKGI